MDSTLDFQTARTLLEWQVGMGVTDAIADSPVNRHDLPDKAPWQVRPSSVKTTVQQAAVVGADPDPVRAAADQAAAAASLDALRAALAEFEYCDLKKGARNLVFCDGRRGARVMIVGEAPGREEDREGRPFVGRAGHMLDRMLAAIGLSRGDSVYITNVLPWRPPQNREPTPAEIAMMRPFLRRHVELAAPDVLVLMGNISCDAVLGRRGILRLRGQWTEAWDVPVLPMVHPAYLLRTPSAKREAWADLLSLQDRVRSTQETPARPA